MNAWDPAMMSPREVECFDLLLAAAFDDDEPDQETVIYWREQGLIAKQARLNAITVEPDPSKRKTKKATLQGDLL